MRVPAVTMVALVPAIALFVAAFLSFRRARRRRAEAAAGLLERRTELERRVEQRTSELERANATMQESATRTTGIVTSAMDAIISVDSQQRVLLFNAAAETMFGYRAAEVLGQPLERFIPQRFRAHHHHHVEGFSQTGETGRAMGALRRIRGVRATGEEFPVEASISRADAGAKKVFTVILRDITDRQRAEDALREREYRLSESQRIAHIGSWDSDLTGRTEWTGETYRIYGVSPDTFIPTPESFVNLLHPEDRPAMQRWLEACGAGQSPDDLEFRAIRPDGTVRFLNGRGELVCDAEGRPTHMAGTVQDITARKQAEEALRESEEKFSKAFHANPAMIVLTTLDGKNVDFNEPYANFVGYSREEMLGKSIPDLHIVGVEERQRILDIIQDASGSVRNVEVPVRTRGGSLLHVLLSADKVSLGGVPHRLATLLDVTERKQAEEALSASEERYRALAETSHDLISLVNRRGEIEYANSVAARLLGVSPRDLIGRQLADVFPLEIADRQQRNLQKVFDSGQSVHVEAPSVFGNDARWLSSWLVPIKDRNDETDTIMVVSRDITDRKRADEALQQSERKYRDLTESLRELIYRADPATFTATFVNTAVSNIYGYSASEWLADPHLWENCIHPDDHDRVLSVFMEARKKRDPGICEYRIIRKDGAVRWVHDRFGWIVDDGGELIALGGVAADITEQQGAQRALEESREQLRQLAGGLLSAREEERAWIAREIHDELGQVLTGLKMDAAWLARHVPDGESAVRSKIAAMSELVDEAVRSVRQVAAELRPGVLDDLGLAAAIEWHADEFRKRSGLRCAVHARLKLEVNPQVSIALFRILQESLTNVARHAGATGARVALEETGGNLVLEVSDDGRGVSKGEIRNPRSVGIAGMRERAKLAGGTCAISSEPGKGTTVRVQIPLDAARRTA